MVLSGLSAGTYRVVVSYGTSCSRSWDFTVLEPGRLQLNQVVSNFNGYNVSCYGRSDGSILLNPSGGSTKYSYSWQQSGSSTIDPIASGQQELGTGYYYVTVADENNCSRIDTFYLSQPDLLSGKMDQDSMSCNPSQDGYAKVIARGGTTPYSYMWSNGATLDSIGSLEADTFFVTVTDINGCVYYNYATIGARDSLLSSIKLPGDYHGQTISCNGASDGRLIAEVNAGSGKSPFTYQWSTGSNNSEITGLAEGTYRVTITDVKSCVGVSQINLEDPDSVISVVETTDASCYELSDGMVEIVSSGGCGGYTYYWTDVWNDSISTDSIVRDLPDGTYYVTANDANSCRYQTSVVIFQPSKLQYRIEVEYPLCPAASDGQIYVEPTGGTGNYTFEWSNGANTNLLEGLSSDIYILTLSDENSCVAYDTVYLSSIRDYCITTPTVFTPNGDGYNETWLIENIDLYPDAEVKVYTRWGNLVFDSGHGYTQPWDGTYRGKPLPVDTYYYIIDLKDGSKPMVGDISIVK